jgi:hypothetical protein
MGTVLSRFALTMARLRDAGCSSCALSVGAAMAVLSGCGGSDSSRAAIGIGDAVRMRTNGLAAAPRIASYAKSEQAAVFQRHKAGWISRDVRRGTELLFVSDALNSAVDIFSLPTLRLKGQVTGFNYPEGECSDQSGNIWVTDEDAQSIVELSRAGSVIRRLGDPTGYPVSCAVDQASGNLAVTNKVDVGSKPGSVEIYAGASGTPNPIRNPDQTQYFFDGYDKSGNLFVDGLSGGSPPAFILSECLAGHQDCSTITINSGAIYFPGMVQWNASRHQVVVGDQECKKGSGPPHSCLYQVAISGSSGEIVRKISLNRYDTGSVCDVVQGVIYGRKDRYLVGSDNEYLCGANSTVNRWRFPAGGIPKNYSTDGGALVDPVGAALSVSK